MHKLYFSSLFLCFSSALASEHVNPIAPIYGTPPNHKGQISLYIQYIPIPHDSKHEYQVLAHILESMPQAFKSKVSSEHYFDKVTQRDELPSPAYVFALLKDQYQKQGDEKRKQADEIFLAKKRAQDVFIKNK